MQSITSNKQFNDLVKTGRPFVIDFYADWCGPCQMLLPTMEKLALDYLGKVDIVKINVDTQKALAAKFKVKGIPAVFFMQNNKVKTSFKGMISEHEIKQKIDLLLSTAQNN